MKLRYCSEYQGYTIFLTEFKPGADAVVFDADAGYCLCKVSDIVENGDSATGDYSAEFVIPDGSFFVGVECVRSAHSPNEFLPDVREFFKSRDTHYC